MPKTTAELQARIAELEREIRSPPPPIPRPSFNQPNASSLATTSSSASSSSTTAPTTMPVVRPKIAEMSSEVRDDNPYSRLMALKRMGIVDDYERIRTFRYERATFHRVMVVEN